MSLPSRVAELEWYHTIALPEGLVTPGFFDTLEGVKRVPLPDSLAGKRCLDIATASGFWAFEMERRGAAEVVALDVPDDDSLDWPGNAPPAGTAYTEGLRRNFELAQEALDSAVQRVELTVYEITPERLGTFDFVFIGNVLLHLRDPVGALAAARSVVAEELFSVDVVSLLATLRAPRAPLATLSRRDLPWWWTPNRPGYRNYFTRAGFDIIEDGRIFFFPFGDGYPARPPLREVVRSLPNIWFWSILVRLGTPSSWIRAKPSS